MRDSKAPRILCVHQGYELYGSDRVFIMSLQALREQWPSAELSVVLPRRGPLFDVLTAAGYAVRIDDIWVARRSNGTLKLLLDALRLPAFVWRAARQMRDYDLCYVSTTVIFDFQLAARFVNRPTLIHVHEMPTGIVLAGLRALLRVSGALVIFNSLSSSQTFSLPPAHPQVILLNGVPDSAQPGERAPFADGDDTINLLMIGRLSHNKGQDLLLQAAALLPAELRRRLRIRIAGAAFNGGSYEAGLLQSIETLGLTDTVSFQGFVDDPTPLYQWSDIVVVPSRRAESFGLVAVEGMVHGRPIIGSRHGGLSEIIVEGKTGLVFEVDDVEGLAACLETAATQPALMAELGRNGRKRYEANYSDAAYLEAFKRLIAAELHAEAADDATRSPALPS